MISLSQRANTTLQILDSAAVISALFHTREYNTIWLNGDVPVSGKFSESGNLNPNPISFSSRPADQKELFNLQHQQAQDVVKHIFGIIKGRWDILTHPPEHDMDIQARVLPAPVALHNQFLFSSMM